MTPFWTSRCGLVSTYVGDALTVLRQMPANSVHCCVTSPPYYGLRDYGTASWDGGDAACDHHGPRQATLENLNRNTGRGANAEAPPMPFKETCGKCGAVRVDQQIGLEKTPGEFIAKLVEVFREVRRVLHPSGTCWVNMGDSYNASGGSGPGPKQQTNGGSLTTPDARAGRSGYKPKDLLGIPWALAFALRDDGWYLRQDIIWAKPSPMPESVTDRCTKSHEYVFLLAKNPSYFYDAEAIKERSLSVGVPMKTADGWDSAEGAHGTIHRNGREQGVYNGDVTPPLKNRRSVWNIASAPYAEAHFATYPPELIRPMIRAGTSEKGVCPKCLAPWVRVTEKTKLKRERPNDYVKPRKHQEMKRRCGSTSMLNSCSNSTAGVAVQTKGWEPSCDCEAGLPIPATVIDIFGGSGTSGMVARQEGRRCLLIELNPEYALLHKARVEMAPALMDDGDAPLFAQLLEVANVDGQLSVGDAGDR